jgi:hypothetical protein
MAGGKSMEFYSQMVICWKRPMTTDIWLPQALKEAAKFPRTRFLRRQFSFRCYFEAALSSCFARPSRCTCEQSLLYRSHDIRICITLLRSNPIVRIITMSAFSLIACIEIWGEERPKWASFIIMEKQGFFTSCQEKTGMKYLGFYRGRNSP